MGITHLSGLQVAGVPTMGTGGLPPFNGNWYFVDYYSGSDGASGTADDPLKTLYQAQVRMTDGNNDVAVIVPNPLTSATTTGTQRLSYANAVAANASATSGTLLWAKNACHIIGMGGPVQNARCRLAPEAAGTAATFLNSQTVGTNPLVKVTGTGCIFMNFSIFGGFATGNAGMITWAEAGGQNYYNGVDFQGQADAASAGGANSRTLTIAANDTTFCNCVIGTDDVSRVTTGTKTVELLSAAAHTRFYNCEFPLLLAAAAAGTNTIATAGSASISDWALFNGCSFLNCSTFVSGGVAQTGAILMGASAGGVFLFKNCTFVGATGTFASGDTTTAGQMYMDGGGPVSNATASSTGVAIHPYV